MGKKLVIVESPAKAKTINKILGGEYIVRASMGHVRDLPEKKLGVSIKDNFEPTYVAIKGKQKVVTELKKALKEADDVYLAPDPDREGEAIAWHLQELLKNGVSEDHFFRVTYNEITANAIRSAFSQPHRIDRHKVDSQQARRILDRIVGYKVSPLLWGRVKRGTSAGRVQSVALRLVCEREAEITEFIPVKYWILGARVKKQVDPKDPFDIKLVKIDDEKADIKSAETAEELTRRMAGLCYRVSAVKTREIRKRARPPYITSTLQQAGSSVFGFSPSRTMSVAQKLYEGVDFGEGPVGLITYMRTDSVSIAKEAQANARKLIGEMYGDEYVPEKPNFYKSRGSAQEAHEAIRPTDVTRTPDEMQAHLDPQQAKLYRLIWTRFVASQMAPAVIAQRSVEIDGEPQGEDAGSTLRFRASASEILFPGYMKATGEDQKKKKKAGDKNGNGNDKGDEDDEIDVLPPMEEGELLDFLEALSEEKETQPPPRYSEASLVRVLEENGVGRPSTYAAIISTLLNRNYVEKEKRSLRPTGLGQNVNKFLVENLDALFNVEFTAKMEESLDQIESGNVEWTQMLSTFYNDFAQWVEKAKGPPADENQVRRLLELLEGVNEWKPPQKRGKRTYSDEKFVDSVRRQFEAGEKKLSQRQAEALMRLAARYKDQLPKYDEVIKDLGLENKAAAQPQPPLEATIAKLEGLKSVQFDEPREVRGRTYDDGEFVNSLRQQVEGGRRLSHKQVKYLDRLVTKYAEQLGGVEEIARKFDVAPAVVVEDPETGDLLDLLKHVTTWKDPVQRGKRTWDDHKFYESLRRQYKQKNSLSEKQVSSLKKMIARYADQVPDFESAAERFDIKTKKKKKAE